jgi:hypothetical protein
MLKNNLSLNRIANLFFITMNHLKKYEYESQDWTKEQKLQHLKRAILIIDIAIGVIDRKIKLKGISQEFIKEAKIIKSRHAKENKNWYEYLNLLEWFKST